MDQTAPKKLFTEFPSIPTSDWEAKIMADLKGGDYAKKLIWKTDEGFDVKPYYRAEDLAGLEYLRALPGASPFVRGLRKQGNNWLIRQDILSKEIGKSNAMALEAIAKGAGSVGLQANEVSTHRQMGELLAGIDLTRIPVNFISAQSYPLALEFLIYELKHQGVDGGKMNGSINFDPICYLLLHGDFYISWENNLEEAEYLLRIIRENLPNFKAITINGHYFHNAGATAVQELAFSMASASEYLAGLTDRGAATDDVAPKIQYALGVGPNYFLEIAKLRAARLLWTRMLEQYKATKEESYKLFIHSSTASWNMSLYDPYVNMLRTTTEGMSAALGNADSVTILPFDNAFRESDDFSRRIARNQQLVLKEESYLDKIADPAAGSYYIESLTHSIASHAWELFKTVEGRGGIIECIKSGFIQDEIARSRDQKEADIAQRKIIMLGTNQYPNPLENMSGLVAGAQEQQDVPASTYKKITPFRVTAAFEKLRLATEKFIAAGNKRPAVFLLTIGNLAMLRARAGFASNFFGCAGFEIIDNPGFQSIDEGVAAALASGAEIVVICSADDEYPEFVPGIAKKMKEQGSPAKLLVAGYPKEFIEPFKAAGIDQFIHVRSNLLETLQEFQQKLGIK